MRDIRIMSHNTSQSQSHVSSLFETIYYCEKPISNLQSILRRITTQNQTRNVPLAQVVRTGRCFIVIFTKERKTPLCTFPGQRATRIVANQLSRYGDSSDFEKHYRLFSGSASALASAQPSERAFASAFASASPFGRVPFESPFERLSGLAFGPASSVPVPKRFRSLQAQTFHILLLPINVAFQIPPHKSVRLSFANE